MKITADQMKVFQRSAEHAWVLELRRHLRVHHGKAVASFDDEELREKVAQRIARARGHGLTYRSTITFFVALTFELTPDFDRHPVVQAALAEGAETPDERAEQLPWRVPGEVWSALRPADLR